jgi:hypothetical protein
MSASLVTLQMLSCGLSGYYWRRLSRLTETGTHPGWLLVASLAATADYGEALLSPMWLPF